MELPGTAYLYTVALLGMTFVGFSAIVMLLREGLGRRLRPFDALFAHVYMEAGLVISMGAMLPPLVAFWDLSANLAWRVSSALVGLALILFAVTYPARRRAASGERTPAYVRVNLALIYLITLAFVLTAVGVFGERAGAAFLTAITAFMIYSVATWLRALGLILATRR